MRNVIGNICFIVAIPILIYFGWKFERYIHYKFSYQASVKSEIDIKIKPLNDEIKQMQYQIIDLQRQILKLNGVSLETNVTHFNIHDNIKLNKI